MLSPAAIQADHAPQPDGVFLSLFVIKEGKIKIPHIVCAPTPHITQATSNLFPPRTLPPAKKCQSKFTVTHGLSLETFL